ncbi:unannotated protein [freshwater metagenome]|uniref:Unannotated protein n=1 Tax=freshwater metagenome TaxID=449393 RepID=A0A6J6Z2K9_9ZZZZ
MSCWRYSVVGLVHRRSDDGGGGGGGIDPHRDTGHCTNRQGNVGGRARDNTPDHGADDSDDRCRLRDEVGKLPRLFVGKPPAGNQPRQADAGGGAEKGLPLVLTKPEEHDYLLKTYE